MIGMSFPPPRIFRSFFASRSFKDFLGLLFPALALLPLLLPAISYRLSHETCQEVMMTLSMCLPVAQKDMRSPPRTDLVSFASRSLKLAFLALDRRFPALTPAPDPALPFFVPMAICCLLSNRAFCSPALPYELEVEEVLLLI